MVLNIHAAAGRLILSRAGVKDSMEMNVAFMNVRDAAALRRRLSDYCHHSKHEIASA